MTPSNRYNFLVTNHKEMKIYKLLDQEWKIIVLRKLRELQEKTDNSIKSGKQYMNKIKSLIERNHKKEPSRSFGAKSTMNKIKNATEPAQQT